MTDMRFSTSSMLPTPLAIILGTEAGFLFKFEPDDPKKIAFFDMHDALADIQKIALAGGSIEEAKIMFRHWTKGLAEDEDYAVVETVFQISTMEIKGELIRKISELLSENGNTSDKDKLEAAKVINDVLKGDAENSPGEIPSARQRKTLVIGLYEDGKDKAVGQD